MTDTVNNTEKPATYQVLARKYRPETFKDLYGQDAMVRTLKNAFEADRIAHAFIMTGIRGTGKTTTARIIAKGLNCVGVDGKGGPTIEPCGQCDACISIAAGRHVDVLEMDAASRTGVGDIREIIDSVQYRAASARYKVYIIDEVHMLSTSAFNALLKTLEEPPEHVKFIFATTEIRKVPVTVLSRCQRFDLRRFEPETMTVFLHDIIAKEGTKIAEDALALIIRASEGSARDALSLLDQAMAHSGGKTSAEQVRAMLGLADRGRVLDLFDLIMKGDAAAALAELSGQYAEGADPLAVLRDLAEVTHWISVVKISPEAADDPTVSPDERERGKILAGLPMRALTRMWQMLLKALEEVSVAPNAMMATEMAIIRLTHIADLPSPEELVRKLQNTPQPAAAATPAAPGANPSGPQAVAGSGGNTMAALAPQTEALQRFVEFEDVLELIRARRDMQLMVEVEKYVRLVRYAPGVIEFQPTQDAPVEFAGRLSARLQNWTGTRWAVSVVQSGGGQTIADKNAEQVVSLHAEAREHGLVIAALDAFPGAEISDVKIVQITDETNEFVVPIDPDEMDDDWEPVDPFSS
ncbi:MAG: DNA polymerase III subunit gamma/tau [Rhodobacteraceae bacterium]|nr:DNA polymerase III subunit gamma/tau [Paracoccaceae bacterium]